MYIGKEIQIQYICVCLHRQNVAKNIENVPSQNILKKVAKFFSKCLKLFGWERETVITIASDSTTHLRRVRIWQHDYYDKNIILRRVVNVRHFVHLELKIASRLFVYKTWLLHHFFRSSSASNSTNWLKSVHSFLITLNNHLAWSTRHILQENQYIEFEIIGKIHACHHASYAIHPI